MDARMSARFGATTSIREQSRVRDITNKDRDRSRREEARLSMHHTIFSHPDYPDSVFVRSIESNRVYRLVGEEVDGDGVVIGAVTGVFA